MQADYERLRTLNIEIGNAEARGDAANRSSSFGWTLNALQDGPQRYRTRESVRASMARMTATMSDWPCPSATVSA
jgi:hypothetical protein